MGYGDGLSVIISDFLTYNNFDDAVNYLASKKRDILCIQVLSQEELNPKSRGKMHFFDSEDGDKSYRKNINRDIIRAYKKAFEYITDRVSGLCSSRGGDYMLVSAEDSVAEVFFNKLVNMEVVK